MRYVGFTLLLCLGLALCGCDNDAKRTDAPVTAKASYATVDYARPESVLDTYYKALFVNDTDTAYNLIWERDRWFVFDDEFRAKYRVNTFVYPDLVADMFSYEFLAFTQNEDSAEISVQITAPDLTMLTDIISQRLLDAAMPPISKNEVKALIANTNWNYYHIKADHRLLLEDGRWYVYFDFETLETIAEFLRQADRLLDTRDADKIKDAREKYFAVLALDPDSAKAREGLALAEERLAAVYDAGVYIQENMELFDFNSKDYNVTGDGLPVPGVTFKIRNNGPRDLAKILVRVTFYSGSGREVSSELVDVLDDFGAKDKTPLLKAGAVWQFSQTAYYRTVSNVAEWQYNWQPGQAKAEIEDVFFADEM